MNKIEGMFTEEGNERVTLVAVGLKAMYGAMMNVIQGWEMPEETADRLEAILDEAIEDAFIGWEEHIEVSDTVVREEIMQFVSPSHFS